ncbi:aldo/keto reductase [Streptomyces canus]|uniref:aldo/keto reductase n=1 Tax=Streptomyces canus TaxID=58343 RepID=UPI0003661D13|nr:aldo/keto reductase [Streptomyces canus]
MTYDTTSLRKLGSSGLTVFPFSLGGNVFGWTADAYTAAGGNSGGESETVIGNWMAVRGNRDDVVIATKVSQRPDFPGLTATDIKAAADTSLQRLRTDRIDLLRCRSRRYELESVAAGPRSAGAGKHLDTERGRKVLAAQPTVAAPIASARTVEQLAALLGVGELTLTEEEVARLTQASA